MAHCILPGAILTCVDTKVNVTSSFNGTIREGISGREFRDEITPLMGTTLGQSGGALDGLSKAAESVALDEAEKVRAQNPSNVPIEEPGVGTICLHRLLPFRPQPWKCRRKAL
jgi:hypothetical protein